MKEFFKYIFLLTLTPCVIKAQVNLVPNPSFEIYDTCPNSTAQLNYTINWKWVGSSTDYYNACSPPGNMSVPSNIYGYQFGGEGTAYIGMNTFIPNEGPPYTIREPAGTNLTQALLIGQKYFLSFKAVMTLNNFESCCASNKLGALLSTYAFTSINGNNPAPVKNFAHVYSDSIISDTLNWATISGSFVSDSAYTFISIGNFFDSVQTQYIDYNGLYGSYYYIDDVRLSTDSVFGLGINSDRNFMSDVVLFPNPSNGTLKIKFQTIEERLMVISDIIGQEVFSSVIIEDVEMLDLTFLNNGTYLILIKNDRSIFTYKLTINKQ